MEPIDIVLPAHNEGGSIAATLREFHQVAAANGIPVRFVVAEDGSTDGTPEIVGQLANELPILLLSQPGRKGYSRAVVDGLRSSTSQVIGFIDSDGQCDPVDFVRLYDRFQKSGCDVVIGYRDPRRDHWIRLLMSTLFKFVYSFYFKSTLKDPSCPYLIIKRASLLRLLEGNPGILKQGFWWEFAARIAALNLKVEQVPVTHRVRAAGVTQVYRPNKVPRIAWEHLRGLSQLKQQLANLPDA